MQSFKDYITEDKAAIHSAIGSDYTVTHSPQYDHDHIAAGKGHGIKVAVKNVDPKYGASHHRDLVKKALAAKGHRVAHGPMTSSNKNQEFHLTVYGKGK